MIPTSPSTGSGSSFRWTGETVRCYGQSYYQNQNKGICDVIKLRLPFQRLNSLTGHAFGVPFHHKEGYDFHHDARPFKALATFLRYFPIGWFLLACRAICFVCALSRAAMISSYADTSWLCDCPFLKTDLTYSSP